MQIYNILSSVINYISNNCIIMLINGDCSIVEFYWHRQIRRTQYVSVYYVSAGTHINSPLLLSAMIAQALPILAVAPSAVSAAR